ncbi:TonB-dependent receptor [Ferruginibacter sp. SUN106]|uniref:TonB-dependent receptor n=1 Tax=Ferruginibacter sp. SUN106 TaxID=2978348 RepID=UPI003D36B313
MKRLLLLTMIICFAATGFAQKNIVKGQLTDTLQKQPIQNATVSIVKVKDSSLAGFTRTDAQGRFTLTNLQPGQYRLSVSMVGFHPLWKMFEITDEKEIDLGNIKMKDKSLMDEVTIQNQRPPVQVNGDTLEFNAEAFKTKPNAVVEDMLKKMPGVEVDKDGTIRVNGQKISRVYVNGKEFFGNDPKIATRNLDADAVDKVQVFDKKSDQAEFTGVDDGNSEKALNLKLKKDRKKMNFGKVTAGLGTKGSYDGQFNINRFNGEQQLSAIGMANNTNRQGFTFSDILNFTGEAQRMMRGGGGRIVINNNGPADFGLPVQGMNNSEGIAKTIAGGVNFNTTWKKKTEVNGSYFYNNINLGNDKTTSRENLSPVNPFVYNENSSSNKKSESNRMNFTIDSKLDSFNSIKFTPQFTTQHNQYHSNSTYQSLLTGDKLLNNGFTNSTTDATGFNYSSNFLFRHKFKKKGRTFSSNINTGYNDTKSNGTLQSINSFYNNSALDYKDTLDQVNKLHSSTASYGINLSYTEPLSKRALLEMNSFYNQSNGALDKKTYDLNSQNGKHDVMNDALSNTFKSEYTYTGGGINLRSQKNKITLGIGTAVQYASLLNRLKDNSTIRQHFTNLLPAANFNYNFTKTKSLGLRYTTSTQQPTPAQLQPVKDVSDPLNIKEGNPNLKQQYQHDINLNYFTASPLAQHSFFAYANFNMSQNAIVNADVLDQFGSRTTTYNNLNGVYNLFTGIEAGFKIKKLNTRFNIGTNSILYNNYNFLNAVKNRITNLAFTPRLGITYNYKEKFDISTTARFGYNKIKYSLQPAFNDHYWRNTYEADANINLPWNISINNEFSYSVNTGRSQGYNKNVALWNAAITKGLFKFNRGTLKLSVFDLLNQNIGISRNANLNYIEDASYKVLNRFYMASFTYNLRKAGNSGPQINVRIN